MTTAYWCVLAAGLMPFLFTGIAKISGRGFDNRDPRSWQSRLSGMPQRAHAAHLNSFEALPLFAAAVIIAHVGGAEQSRIDALALAFVGLRLGFGACYLADWATLRSLVWVAALGCCVALFFIIP
jgi:uncharacterized MAPEG superfamily protein